MFRSFSLWAREGKEKEKEKLKKEKKRNPQTRRKKKQAKNRNAKLEKSEKHKKRKKTKCSSLFFPLRVFIGKNDGENRTCKRRRLHIDNTTTQRETRKREAETKINQVADRTELNGDAT